MSANDPRYSMEHLDQGNQQSGMRLTPWSLLIVLIVFYMIIQVQVVVLLILFALLFATLIERPVLRLQARGVPRAAGILTMYAAILSVLVVVGLVFVPLISREVRAFSDEAPSMIDELAQDWRASDSEFLSRTGYRYLQQLKFRLENPPPLSQGTAVGLLTGVGTALFGFIATFVIGFYYLMEKSVVKGLLLRQMRPASRARANALWTDVESKVGDWLRGQLFLCLIIGVAAGIGYGFIGLRFWLLLALFAGITELIPIVGPWIGGIPAFMVALLDSWEKAVAVAVFLIILQFVENSILVPRVMRGTIGLSPLTVFLAVLIGGQFMGPLGALLALPFAAAIQVLIADALRVREARTEFATAEVAAMPSAQNWRTILTQFLGDPDHPDAPPRGPGGTVGPSGPAVKPDAGERTREPGSD